MGELFALLITLILFLMVFITEENVEKKDIEDNLNKE